MRQIRKSPLIWLLAALVVQPPTWRVAAQEAAPQPPTFKPEEIEQLVAPIALYPDALLAQTLMASTYPLEVVAAARWVKENPKVEGTALEDAMQKQSWDPSVKSLTAFPQVLAMMDAKLDWTQKLGDAFLAQQNDVMDAVQRLRAKAQAEGNLKTTPEQTVIVEQQPANVEQKVVVQQQPAAAPQTTVIKIEPTNPQVVYVPTYNPTVVYGAWPYPAYPPPYLLPARIRCGHRAALVRRRSRSGLRALGRLQLGRRVREQQREHQYQQLQQLQQDEHQQRQLAAQRRPPQGRAVSRSSQPAALRARQSAGGGIARRVPRTRREWSSRPGARRRRGRAARGLKRRR